MLFSTKNSLGGGIVNRLVKKATSTLIVTSLIVGSCPLALADYQDGESTVYYESSIKAPSIGNYEFEVETHEVPSHEWLPIVSKDYFPSTTAQFITEVDNLPPSATYEAKALTKVDVVFAFGEMSQSQQMQDYMDSFEQRLGSAGNNIDAYVEKVETSTISSSDYDIDSILNSWSQYGAHVWSSNGGMLTCALPGGSSGGSWQGTLMIDESALETTDVTIECTSNNSAELMEGVCWHVTQNPDGTFNGYFLNFGAHGYSPQGMRNGVSLMKFSNVDFTQSFSGSHMGALIWCGYTGPNYQGKTVSSDGASITHLATYGYLLTGKVKVTVSGTNMEVFYNGKSIMKANDSEYPAGTYGFWGNNCEVSRSMLVSDISIIKGTSKSLGEAISDVAWRDNSVRFVIYGEDTIPEYMQSAANADYQYTVTKLLNSNAYLIPLGTSTNKSVMEQLIKSISSPADTKGKFINNVPIITAMKSACDWIVSLVRNNSKPTQWILVNTPIVWNTIYKDSEHDLPLNFGEHDGQGESLSDKSDTSDVTLASSWGVGLSHYFSNQDKILAEKWRYIHHYTFYDNSTREETFSNVWISDPVEIFPEPGLYRINYKRKDNPFYTDVNLSNPFDEYRYWSTDYDPVVQQ